MDKDDINYPMCENEEEALRKLAEGSGVGIDFARLRPTGRALSRDAGQSNLPKTIERIAVMNGMDLAEVEARILAAMAKPDKVVVLDSLIPALAGGHRKNMQALMLDGFYGEAPMHPPVLEMEKKPYMEPKPQEPRTVNRKAVRARRAKAKRARKARRRG